MNGLAPFQLWPVQDPNRILNWPTLERPIPPRRKVDRAKLPRDPRSVAMRRYFAVLREARKAGFTIDRREYQGGRSATTLTTDELHRMADDLELIVEAER